MSAREECCVITSHNGAYLIAMMGSLTDDLTPSELYDCARALPVARRVAKERARALGYESLRWVEELGFVAVLEGVDPKALTR